MSFLYPLFLLAGLSIAVPVLIHLFNLRRYRTVYFPNIRFLKDVSLHSKKQSQVRYKWLLFLRILFLVFLILAFTQPFFNKNTPEKTSGNLQVIYLDNSSSMSLKQGTRSLLDMAKEKARRQLEGAGSESRFILLTNDKPASFVPVPAEKVLNLLPAITTSAASQSASKVFTTVRSLVQSESAPGADIYFYSDFQRNHFPQNPDKESLKNIHFYGIPIRADEASNIFIDTAFFAEPRLQAGAENRLIVQAKFSGKPPKESPVLQLSVNGQVKNAASLDFKGHSERTDTLGFQVNDAGWQELTLTVNDAGIRFDDTFRIAAKTGSGLSVLILNEAQPNPYLQAAFRSYSGFRMNQKNIGEDAEWDVQNLIILNGITDFSNELVKKTSEALQRGQSICIFPGKTTHIASLNAGLEKIAGIQITGIDTIAQNATSFQQGSPLVRELFERIPENVELPLANWHYQIRAELDANQQSVLSFRNGDPLLAQFSPSRGKLYLLSTASDIEAGNFAGSYFFVPFLYQMTAQSKSNEIFALTSGSEQPVYIPMPSVNERNMIHVYGSGLDLIPPQRTEGGGVQVFLQSVLHQPGFYTLASAGSDSVKLALNSDRSESRLEMWDLNQLKKQWNGNHISWIDPENTITGTQSPAFPLWKICVFLALALLAAETFWITKRNTVKPLSA